MDPSVGSGATSGGSADEEAKSELELLESCLVAFNTTLSM